jgi:hypothetical protein
MARTCSPLSHAAGVFLALMIGCADGSSNQAPGNGATLEANPNPVPLTSEMGTTQISWNTGVDEPGRVYVSQDGGPEKLFGEGPHGSNPAPWIQEGVEYEFRLYAGNEGRRSLATILVTGKRASGDGEE